MANKIFFMLVIALFFIASCASQTQEIPQAVKNLQKFVTATVEHPNKPAPSFKLTDDKGRTFTNDDLKGKVYILQGFATGCSSCAREISALNDVYIKYKDKGLEIISLNVAAEKIQESIDTKKKFNGGDWRWTIDSDDVAIKFGIETLESTYIVDEEGIIRYKDESLSDSNILSKEIEKLI